MMTYFAVLGRGLRRSERAFTALAWLPKATVQAALGAVALDSASTEREREMGRAILTISVLSILCTAPVGATIIGVSGPKLLVLEKTAEDEAADVEAPAEGDSADSASKHKVSMSAEGDSSSKQWAEAEGHDECIHAEIADSAEINATVAGQ